MSFCGIPIWIIPRPSVKQVLSECWCRLQITNGLPDPALSSFSHMDYALKGVRKKGQWPQRCSHLPITPQLLCNIYQAWAQEPWDFDRTMLWAAVCLGFVSFMQAGEFTCPSLEAFTSDMLSPRDMSVDSRLSPFHPAVHLKRSKTDHLELERHYILVAEGTLFAWLLQC